MLTLEQIVKVINREPKSVVANYLLSCNSFRKPYDIEKGACKLFGDVSGFSNGSINGYFTFSLSPLVIGDKEGYKLKDDQLAVRKALKFALRYSAENNLSMYNVFSADKSAFVVTRLLRALLKEKDLRVTDLSEDLKVPYTTVTEHMLRLQKLGFVEFERFEGGVKFKWSDKAKIENFEDTIRESLKSISDNRAGVISRAINVGNFLYKNYENFYSAREITKGIKCSKTDFMIYYNASCLRILEGLGFVVPNNDFRGGKIDARLTRVNITSRGIDFCSVFDTLENYESLPEFEISNNVIKKSLELYSNIVCKKKPADTRLNQILILLENKPGLSRKEVAKEIGADCGNYLRELIKLDLVKTIGRGKKNYPYKYELKIREN